MNEKYRKLILIFSICLNIGFIVAAGYASYQHNNRSLRTRHLSKFNSSLIFEIVDLSPQQKVEIDQLVQLFHANMVSNSKAVAPLKAKMLQRMGESPPLNESEAKGIIDEMNVLQNRRGDLTYQHLQAIRQLLTEEQAQIVFKRMAEIQNSWARKVKSQP